jgi:hypothetical protein
MEHWKRGNEFSPLLAPLATECLNRDIPEEEMV